VAKREEGMIDDERDVNNDRAENVRLIIISSAKYETPIDRVYKGQFTSLKTIKQHNHSLE
jgi:hypothetical protein